MRRRNVFGTGPFGALGISIRPGDINAGPTTSHLQLALKKRLAAKVAATEEVQPVKADPKVAQPNQASEENEKCLTSASVRS